MTMIKNVDQAMSLSVTEGLNVTIIPNSDHEFLMTTKEVAVGYGSSKYAVFKALRRNSQELIEGKHFIRGVDILSTPSLGGSVQLNSILFTKRGIIRLGFFIKSERAKLFRDWAEELIVKVHEQLDLFGNPVVAPVKKLSVKRLDNRLDKTRMIRLLSLVNQVSDDTLRSSIVDELIGGLDYGLYLQKGGLYDNA